MITRKTRFNFAQNNFAGNGSIIGCAIKFFVTLQFISCSNDPGSNYMKLDSLLEINLEVPITETKKIEKTALILLGNEKSGKKSIIGLVKGNEFKIISNKNTTGIGTIENANAQTLEFFNKAKKLYNLDIETKSNINTWSSKDSANDESDINIWSSKDLANNETDDQIIKNSYLIRRIYEKYSKVVFAIVLKYKDVEDILQTQKGEGVELIEGFLKLGFSMENMFLIISKAEMGITSRNIANTLQATICKAKSLSKETIEFLKAFVGNSDKISVMGKPDFSEENCSVSSSNYYKDFYESFIKNVGQLKSINYENLKVTLNKKDFDQDINSLLNEINKMISSNIIDLEALLSKCFSKEYLLQRNMEEGCKISEERTSKLKNFNNFLENLASLKNDDGLIKLLISSKYKPELSNNLTEIKNNFLILSFLSHLLSNKSIEKNNLDSHIAKINQLYSPELKSKLEVLEISNKCFLQDLLTLIIQNFAIKISNDPYFEELEKVISSEESITLSGKIPTMFRRISTSYIPKNDSFDLIDYLDFVITQISSIDIEYVRDIIKLKNYLSPLKNYSLTTIPSGKYLKDLLMTELDKILSEKLIVFKENHWSLKEKETLGELKNSSELHKQRTSEISTPKINEYMQEAEKGNTYCQSKMGLCYYAGSKLNKDYNETAKWYIDIAKNNKYAQCQLGDLYYFNKNYVKAIEFYSLALNNNALNTTQQYNLGDCYFYNGDFRNAKTHYEVVNNAEKLDEDARIRLADCYSNLKQYADAIKLYTTVEEEIKLNNKEFQLSIDTNKNLAVCYYKEKKYKEAAEIFIKINKDSSKEDNLDKIANCCYSLKDYENCIKYYEPLLKIEGKLSANEKIELADSYFSQKNYANALKLYEATPKTCPLSTQRKINLANSYYFEKVLERALELYCTLKDQLDLNSQFNYANSCALSNKNIEAVEIYKKILLNKKELELSAKYNLANCYYELKNYGEAIKLYSEIDTLGELLPKEQYKVGDYFFSTKQDYIKAEKWYLKAYNGGFINSNKQLAICNYNIGKILDTKLDFINAEGFFIKALQYGFNLNLSTWYYEVAGFYFNGNKDRKIKENYLLAHKFYKKAEAKGSKEATEGLSKYYRENEKKELEVKKPWHPFWEKVT